MRTSKTVAEFFEVDEGIIEDLLGGCDIISEQGSNTVDFDREGPIIVESIDVYEPDEEEILKYANDNNIDPWEDEDSCLVETVVFMERATGIRGEFWASYNKSSRNEGDGWYFTGELHCFGKTIKEV